MSRCRRDLQCTVLVAILCAMLVCIWLEASGGPHCLRSRAPLVPARSELALRVCERAPALREQRAHRRLPGPSHAPSPRTRRGVREQPHALQARRAQVAVVAVGARTAHRLQQLAPAADGPMLAQRKQRAAARRHPGEQGLGDGAEPRALLRIGCSCATDRQGAQRFDAGAPSVVQVLPATARRVRVERASCARRVRSHVRGPTGSWARLRPAPTPSAVGMSPSLPRSARAPWTTPPSSSRSSAPSKLRQARPRSP